MKGIRVMAGVMVASAVAFGWSVSAQEAGRAQTLTGCLVRAGETQKKDVNGNASRDATYRLTEIEGTGPKTAEIAAAPKSLPLYANHKVTVTATAVQGADRNARYLRVTGIRTLSIKCP